MNQTKSDETERNNDDRLLGMLGMSSGSPAHDPATYRVRLSRKQEKAVALLLTGLSVTEVAMQLKVTRPTVSYWINRHFEFKRVLELGRQVVWQTSRDQLTSLTDDAIKVMKQHLDNNSLAAAIAVIKAVGLGDRLQVMEAKEGRARELEKDRSRFDLIMFREALAQEVQRRAEKSSQTNSS